MESKTFNINRRNFLKGATAAAVLSSFGTYGFELMYRDKPWRVGLIGAGWYGSSDLFKLIQVANVEVIAICDVDSNFVENTANLVAQRQRSGKKPKKYSDYRE
ncbi:MAG: twin-arginine translocation signal domain-containing protein, partial [Eudoraea sp.]